MKYRQHDVADDSSPAPGEQKPGGPLTKITINLLPRTVKALEEVSVSTGDTKTECINRAVQIYAWLQARIAAGDQFQVMDKEGRTREIQIF